MNSRRGLVLDANILLRAVFGFRVRHILESYEDVAGFYTPDACVDEAREYIPELSKRRGLDSSVGMSVLEQVTRTVVLADKSLYESFGGSARERIRVRDEEDWPVVAVALMLDLPVWTEDRDFFGSGVATWTTDRVELYLRGSA